MDCLNLLKNTTTKYLTPVLYSTLARTEEALIKEYGCKTLKELKDSLKVTSCQNTLTPGKIETTKLELQKPLRSCVSSLNLNVNVAEIAPFLPYKEQQKLQKHIKKLHKNEHFMDFGLVVNIIFFYI